MTGRPIRNMVNHETNEVFFEDFEVPAANLIGEEGQGFSYILDGMNAERILIAASASATATGSSIARAYAGERIVFDRPIGKNQGVQFPIARAYANVRAADLMRYEAARLFDEGKPAGAEANMAKLLAADASWEAANVCLQTFGGFGFARSTMSSASSGDAAVSGGADLDESDPFLHRGARARDAEVVLMRLTRSQLFVPASKPAMIRKAAASAADAVCIDLEIRSRRLTRRGAART